MMLDRDKLLMCEYANVPDTKNVVCPRTSRKTCKGTCPARRKPTREYLKKKQKANYKEYSAQPTDSCFTGALTELQVALFFMERGFYVFRCVSSTSPIDLVVFDGKTCFTVDVKKGGSFHRNNGQHQADVLARLADGKIRIRSNKLTIDGYETESLICVPASTKLLPNSGNHTIAPKGGKSNG